MKTLCIIDGANKYMASGIPEIIEAFFPDTQINGIVNQQDGSRKIVGQTDENPDIIQEFIDGFMIGFTMCYSTVGADDFCSN